MAEWRLQRRKVLSRPSVYDRASRPVMEWEIDPNYPPFASRKAAVRMFLEGIDKDLKGASDEFLERHWRTPFYRNMIRVTCVKAGN